MEKITLLGASGSIGRQTLDIIYSNPNDFSLVGFSVGKQINQIEGILSKFRSVKYVYLIDEVEVAKFSKRHPSIHFYSAKEGLLDLIKDSKPTMVVNALVGFVGLKPTLFALENNLKVALANKEALVVGGELVNALLAQGKGVIYPIDSEHSAIYKCLKVDNENVDKLIITASGGAFRDLNRDELVNVKAIDALKHPTWNMGAKITIDCATMVNKAFEIIEAYYLFNYGSDHIEVLLHKESMIHSLVKYKDGTYRAEISKPDMHNPIKFALYEGNIEFQTYVSDDYHKFGDYHFKNFDLNRYPLVRFAIEVIKHKGIYGAVFNAANEEVVYAFLEDKIAFLDIEKIIYKIMSSINNKKNVNYLTLEEIDSLTRQRVKQMIEKGDY